MSRHGDSRNASVRRPSHLPGAIIGTVVVDGCGSPPTPDGRYIVVRGRQWRRTNPALSPEERSRLTADLMKARRDVGSARKRADASALAVARAAVNKAKTALGERGPVWWNDGTPDLNRRMARTTPYAE